MTAHLGGALRRGPRTEPAHRRVEYAHLSKTAFFGSGKSCRIHSRACCWVPGVIFDMIFCVLMCFGAGAWAGLSGDPAAGHLPGVTLQPLIGHSHRPWHVAHCHGIGHCFG